MSERVYKICTRETLQEAERKGWLEGSADDRRDGFIHLSAGSQVEETLAVHFSRCDDLLLLAIDAERLRDQLKWEASRGGALFPHLYGPLDLGHVVWIETLPLEKDGRHRLPPGVVS